MYCRQTCFTTPPKSTSDITVSSDSNSRKIRPGTARHMSFSFQSFADRAITIAGRHQLPERQATVVRWDSRVPQHPEAPASQRGARAAEDERVLEDTAGQRHGVKSPAFPGTQREIDDQ